jgi:predicted TIM-barrel fold metal-dependent hydrolase
MFVLDSQVHVWPAHREDRPLGASGRDRAPYLYETLIADMDRAGVDAAILVPPTYDMDRNDYALEAVRAHPRRFAVMGRVSLRNDRGRDVLASWKSQGGAEKRGMLGVRLTFHQDGNRPWLSDGTADWFWPEAERHGVPVMVHAPECVAAIGKVAERHPGLAIIYDHMAFARETMDAKAMPRVEELLPLARLPNVSVKVSAMPCFSTEPYPFANLREPLRRVIETFGARRCYWGSDITRVPKSCSYRQVVTHFTETLDFLSKDDLDWIMGRALAERLGWQRAR